MNATVHNLLAIRQSGDSIQVTWANSGSGANAIIVKWRPVGSSLSWQQAPVIEVGPTATSCTISGVLETVSYDIRVMPVVYSRGASITIPKVVPPPPSPSHVRPYASDSLWNAPIPASPVIDPRSAAWIAVTAGVGTGLTSDPTQYTYAVYDRTVSSPFYPVFIGQWWSEMTSPSTKQPGHGYGETRLLPVDPSDVATPGSDSQMIVLNASTGDEWGFWQVYNDPQTVISPVVAGVKTIGITNVEFEYWIGQTIYLGWGTANQEAVVISGWADSTHANLIAPTTKSHSAGEPVWGFSCEAGYHYNTKWGDVGQGSGFSSRGAGVTYLAGLVRAWEVAQGHVDHAIAMVHTNAASDFVPPATKSDQGGVPGTDPAMGSRLQLVATEADLTAWGLNPTAKIVARALMTYGAIIIDGGGHLKVCMEDVHTARWGPDVTASFLTTIPWSAFRVVDM